MKLDAGQEMGGQQDASSMDNSSQAAEALAKASAPVMKATELAFGKIPALIQQAMQHIQSNTPKPPMDPMAQVAMANVQAQTQLSQSKLSLQQQQHMDDMKLKASTLQQKADEAAQNYQLEMQRLGLEHQSTMQTTDMKARADLQKTSMDNNTAKEIAAMNMAHEHITHLIDGASAAKPREGE